jgi:hypothetical protein
MNKIVVLTKQDGDWTQVEVMALVSLVFAVTTPPLSRKLGHLVYFETEAPIERAKIETVLGHSNFDYAVKPFEQRPF